MSQSIITWGMGTAQRLATLGYAQPTVVEVVQPLDLFAGLQTAVEFDAQLLKGTEDEPCRPRYWNSPFRLPQPSTPATPP